ncbi:MAG: hypothetical protein H7123_09640 [Thermoleophilia bacterium]|nr:hypothetical protein [Thermoleophilia bacterium]
MTPRLRAAVLVLALTLSLLLGAPVTAHAASPNVIVTRNPGTTHVTEGGLATVIEYYRLAFAPTDTVTITLSPDAQISLDATTLTFTPTSWEQSVRVSAVDDAAIELSPHQGTYTHVVTSADFNYQGAVIDPVQVPITDNDFDTESPVVALAQIADISMTRVATAKWSATDNVVGALSYSITSRASNDSSLTFSAQSSLYGPGPSLDATLALPGDGRLWCMRATATDVSQNIGVSNERCVSVPRDDRTMNQSFGWVQQMQSSAYHGTIVSAAHKGATLTATVYAKRLALIVTTCPTCGKVRVRFGAVRLGTVNLYSATVKKRVVIRLAALPTMRRGTIQIKTQSDALAQIDGLAAWRT